MTLEEAKNLKPGDEVIWDDPDQGICSKRIIIKSASIRDFKDDPRYTTIIITGADDSVLECHLCELRLPGTTGYRQTLTILLKPGAAINKSEACDWFAELFRANEDILDWGVVSQGSGGLPISPEPEEIEIPDGYEEGDLVPANINYSRQWICEHCHQTFWMSYEALAEIGRPFCSNCGEKMKLDAEASLEKHKNRLLLISVQACRSASETLSAEAQEEYVESGGFRCPYCGSTDIAGTGLSDSDADWHSKEIECEDCGKMWDDIYTLSSISEK